MEVTQKDIEDALRAAGVKAGTHAPPAAVVRSDAVSEALRAAGVDPSVASGPTIKAEKLEEAPPERLGPKAQKEAERISKDMSHVAPVAEGMPIIGSLPRMATAGIAAATEPVTGMGMPGPSFGARYGENEAVLREAYRLYSERHPGWAPTGELLGGAAAAVPLGASRLGGLVLGARGPSTGSRLIQGTAGGAALGATDAALRGESGTTGGLIGAMGGAGGPLVGEAARRGTSFAAHNLWPRSGPLAQVTPLNVSRLVSSLEGETPASLQAARERAGPAGMMMDVNRGTTDLAGGLADIPGPQKTTIREAVRLRSAAQSQRVEQALTRNVGPSTDVEAFKDFTTEARKAAADPLYEQWRTTQIQPTDKLKELIPRLEKAGAFGMAEELSGITGEPVTKAFFTGGPKKDFPTAQSWDYVKRGLDRSIDAAYGKGDKTLARALIDLKHETLKEIEAAPGGLVYKQARREFADRSAILDQIEAGRDTFLGGRSGLTVDELKHELKGLGGPERAARLVGLRAAADEVMGATTRGDTTLRNKLLAPNNVKKMEHLLGKDKADDLIKTMKQEEFIGQQRDNIAGGSQTTPKKERVNALSQVAGGKWDPDVAKPLTWLPPSWVDALRPSHIVDAWKAQRHGAAQVQLGDVLTTPDNKLGALLQSIQDESLRRYRADRAGNALSNLVTVPAGVSASTAARRKYQDRGAGASP